MYGKCDIFTINAFASLKNIFFIAFYNFRSTLINGISSRSHAMFSICLNLKTSNSEIASVLNLVDLAGSEGKKTKTILQ